MTAEQLKNILDKTQYPVAYRYFSTPQKSPYICFYFSDNKDFFADGKSYANFKKYRIELYTDGKDETAEKTVETALKDICFEKYEDYIDTVKKTRINYEIEEI